MPIEINSESGIVETTTSGTIIPAGNTQERPQTPAAGTIRINTDTNVMELFDGNRWKIVVFNL